MKARAKDIEYHLLVSPDSDILVEKVRQLLQANPNKTAILPSPDWSPYSHREVILYCYSCSDPTMVAERDGEKGYRCPKCKRFHTTQEYKKDAKKVFTQAGAFHRQLIILKPPEAV